MNCKIKNELIQTCAFCHLLGEGCEGVEEPEICDICGILIVANCMTEHKQISHSNL
jgi:hypothetical protein